MKRSGFAFLLLLGACGGFDYAGTWDGDIERMTVASGVTLSTHEQWHIHDAELDRVRGSESCTLVVEQGTCSRGCYDKVILAGQSCMIDGRTLVLIEGYLSWQGSSARDKADASLSWAASAGATPEIVETGVLIQD